MRPARYRIAVGLCLLLFACSPAEPPPPEPTDQPPFIEAGDLPDIVERGQLRILFPRSATATHLPRRGYPLDFERDLAESYARSLNLQPVWIFVESRNELIPSLLEGKGDFVAASLTATDERKKRVSFTVPLVTVREQLVTRADDEELTGPDGLAGRRVAVRRSSAFWETLDTLRRSHPEIEVEQVAEDVDTEEIIHRVATGEFDVTIADSNLVRACMDYLEGVRPAFDVSRDRVIAWAVRPDSHQLLGGLNRFLTAAQLTRRANATETGDLAEIRKRRVLRVLTRNSAATYFLWRGQLMGFEYDLTRMLAQRHGLRVEMIVPPRGEDLLDWLREGRGDLVAAGLTPGEDHAVEGVAFSRPYNYVSQVVVTRFNEYGPLDRNDLDGRMFHVRPNSGYWRTLEKLRADGLGFLLQPVPAEMTTEEIIGLVADDGYDLTLADSNLLDIELTWRDDVRRAFPIGEPIAQSWAVRESSPELLAAVNEFIRAEYRGLFYNVKYDQYFENPQKIRRHIAARIGNDSGLSPYDELVRRYAKRYGFDWRLIVSQMYQESRFDPQAESFAGARGLMQLLPRTALELGFEDLENPETAIHAGIRYMDWVREQFEADLPVKDRMWFTLAAYNAGAGHVRDARRLAADLGYNPNRWSGNVETAMLLLSRPQYAQAARHGYCRCREPVNYVQEIWARYNAYLEASRS